MSPAEIPRRPAGTAALVTGGGSGIGRATALRLAADGLPVAVLDLDHAAAERTAAEVRAAGGQAAAVQADVAAEAEVARAFADARQALGPISVLANLAGVGSPATPVRDLALDEWHRVLRINLNGTFLCARAALPGMLELGWGRVVNASSTLASKGRAGSAAYASSKAGVIGFTRSLALEVAGKGITVNAVLPSTVDTPLARQGASDDEMRARGQALGIGRIAEPEEVANVIAFLVGDDASYVSGHGVVVSGASYILP